MNEPRGINRGDPWAQWRIITVGGEHPLRTNWGWLLTWSFPKSDKSSEMQMVSVLGRVQESIKPRSGNNPTTNSHQWVFFSSWPTAGSRNSHMNRRNTPTHCIRLPFIIGQEKPTCKSMYRLPCKSNLCVQHWAKEIRKIPPTTAPPPPGFLQTKPHLTSPHPTPPNPTPHHSTTSLKPFGRPSVWVSAPTGQLSSEGSPVQGALQATRQLRPGTTWAPQVQWPRVRKMTPKSPKFRLVNGNMD